MSVLINSPLPESIETFLEERRRTGADRFDEMWEGVLHVAPAPTGARGDLLLQVMEKLGRLARQAGMVPCAGGFNLGSAEDYRIPDGGIRRHRSVATYFDTAALVVEILSPGDETFAKLTFYASHGVEENVIVDAHAKFA
jgi:Uma2 family endonuclease